MNGVDGDGLPERPPERTAEQPAKPTPPARPRMSDDTPPPIPTRLPPPRIVRTSRAVWYVSLLVGLLAILFAFLSRNAQFDRLKTLITDLDPGRDDETLDAVAAVVFWGTIGALAVVILVELLLVLAMLRRHGSARWVLLAFLLVHTAVALIADGFVGLDEEGVLVRAVLAVQLLSACGALILSLLPEAGRWFRARDEPESRPAR